MAHRDPNTLDLFEDWTPDEVVQRFDAARVRTSTLRAKVARAVSETLKDCGRSREDVAKDMSAWLGEDVSKAMLDAYASEAREEHTISYVRLLALVHATGDVRPLQLGAELFDHVVAHTRYLNWIEVGMRADRREQAARLKEEADVGFALAIRAARRGGPRP
jgi:hypothetical protein